MGLYLKVISALREYRDEAIGVGFLALVLCVCVPLLIWVPESRPCGATLIAWTLAFALRVWRFLPREVAHVKRAAHFLADSKMRERGVGKVLTPSSGPCSLPSGSSSSGNRLPEGFSGQKTPGCRGSLSMGSPTPACSQGGRASMERNGVADSTSGTMGGAMAAAGLSFDPYMSSALESSAQFLALAQGDPRLQPYGRLANFHTAPTAVSGSLGADGRCALQRSREPFAHNP